MKKKTNEEFLEQLKNNLRETDDLDKYDTSKVRYVDALTKVVITCALHGDKLILPNKLLIGQRCPECKIGKLSISNRSDWSVVLEKFKEVHGSKYKYDEFEYINNATKGIVICQEHGPFMIDSAHHTRGTGCKECKRKCVDRGKWVADFIEKAKEIHKNRYDYSKVEYGYSKGNRKVIVICSTHGPYLVTTSNHINNKSGCPRCSNKISLSEDDLAKYVESLSFEVERNAPILDKKHIDIFVPSHNLGIEYCGVYFHSDKFKGTTYHKDKFLLAKSKGIQLLQIFEDEWLESTNIIKSMLASKLLITKAIPARKTVVKLVSLFDVARFYENTHLQRGNVVTGITYGLYLKGQLVSCMSFSTSNSKLGEIELVRFSSIGRVVGGFSKLLSFAISGFCKEARVVVSFSDNRWGLGQVYKVNGFSEVSISDPRYWWVKSQQRFTYKYLKRKLKVYDDTLTEMENCKANGYLKIHDAGVTRWELVL